MQSTHQGCRGALWSAAAALRGWCSRCRCRPTNSLAPATTSRLVDSTEYRRSFRASFESVRDAPLNRHDSGQIPLSAFKNVPKQKIFPGPGDVVLATRPLPPQPPHQEEFYDHYDRWNDSDQAVLTRFRGWHPRSVGWM